MTTGIAQRLKEQTRAHHQRLEQKLGWLRPGFSRSDYAGMIELLWGYYAPLENHWAALPDLALALPDIDRRRKTPLLEGDLSVLGLDRQAIARLPQCTRLPRCDSIAEALGCLYVLEGSTLGGQVIARHLHRTLGLHKANGAAFLLCYGAAAEPMWAAFRERLESSGEDEAAQVTSACETFLTLEQWLCPD